MREPRFSTVLFDLDGTLIDSIRLIIESFHHTFTAFGLPLRGDDEWLRGIGTPLRAVLAPYAADEATLDAMLAAYRAHNFEHHDTRVAAFPGVPEAVRDLAAAGVRLGLVTSKSRTGTLRGLRVAALDELITALICAEDVQRPKPDREPVDRAMALLGATPERTLFVGDSVHDMHAGNAAGVTTGAALWGPFAREELAASRPSLWLESPGDVVRAALG